MYDNRQRVVKLFENPFFILEDSEYTRILLIDTTGNRTQIILYLQ